MKEGGNKKTGCRSSRLRVGPEEPGESETGGRRAGVSETGGSGGDYHLSSEETVSFLRP